MEVLNPVYMAPNMTVVTKMTILNIHCACLLKHYGITPFFYEQLILDPRHKNCLSFSKKSSQKIV